MVVRDIDGQEHGSFKDTIIPWQFKNHNENTIQEKEINVVLKPKSDK